MAEEQLGGGVSAFFALTWQSISGGSARKQYREHAATDVNLGRGYLPNLHVEQNYGHHDGDGGDHDVCHCWMQEVNDVVHIRTHEVDDLAALNGLLRPAGNVAVISPLSAEPCHLDT